MADKVFSLSLTVDKATAADLRALLEDLPGSDGTFLERGNAGGGADTWVVVMSLAASSVPHFLNFFRDRKDRSTPKRISYEAGGLKYEIDNPTGEDLDLFRQRLADHDRGAARSAT